MFNKHKNKTLHLSQPAFKQQIMIKRWALKICLVVVAMLGGATVILARSCSTDLSDCSNSLLDSIIGFILKLMRE